MKSQDPDFSQPSRLAQHLSILDLDQKVDDASEAEAINRMKPLPLQLPLTAKKPFLWYLTPLVLAAAAVMLIIFKEPSEQSWSIKGAGSVQVYVERAGEVRSLPDAGPLQPADRIQAEVLATSPSLAFWGVTNREGHPLQDPRWVWDNRLELQPLEKKFFRGSLQLEGPSEGETLCVLVCPAALAEHLEEADGRQQLSLMINPKAKPRKDLVACSQSCFSLRP